MPLPRRSTSAHVLAALLAFAMVAPTPTLARADSLTASAAVPLLFKKKKAKKKKKKKTSAPAVAEEEQPSLSLEDAKAKRGAINDGVAADREAKKWAAVADTLESEATLLGDPVTMMDAGEARLTLAQEERSIEIAEASIVTTKKALDILHYYGSVAAEEADSEWLVIAPVAAAPLIKKAEAQVEAAEALIAEIEAEKTAASAESEPTDEPKSAKKDKKPRKKRGEPKPGTGFIAGGAVASVIGLGGAGLGIYGITTSAKKQGEVEDIPDATTPEGMDEEKRLDDEGKQANLLGYVGLGIAVVGLGVGIPLIVVGAKKRKAAAGAQARIQVSPWVDREHNGLVVSGRF